MISDCLEDGFNQGNNQLKNKLDQRACQADVMQKHYGQWDQLKMLLQKKWVEGNSSLQKDNCIRFEGTVSPPPSNNCQAWDQKIKQLVRLSTNINQTKESTCFATSPANSTTNSWPTCAPRTINFILFEHER